MTLVWQTLDDVTLQEHFRVVPPCDWTPTVLHVCSLSSIYISITHSQEHGSLFVCYSSNRLYLLHGWENKSHFPSYRTLVSKQIWSKTLSANISLRILYRKKPSNREHKNTVGLHVNPRLKWKPEIGRNWICFFNIPPFLGKHAVILSACIRWIVSVCC